MGKPKVKWTLREAVAVLAGPELEEEFRRLDTKWRNAPQFFILGRETDSDRECWRFERLDRQLTGELVQRLQRGDLVAEALDPVRGPVQIHKDAWKMLEPNVAESTATSPSETLHRIRVWSPRTIRYSSSRTEHRCREWMQQLVENGFLPASKTVLLDSARTEFPDLSNRAFDRVWAEIAPADWRRPGRRRPSS